MSLAQNFIPTKPFPDFKWKWAALVCTEGLNDPVVLLGVLYRMRKLEKLMEKEKRLITYSSAEFANELIALSQDIKNSGVNVDLARRTGDRNLIRNSGQYWRAVGLIPTAEVQKRDGIIKLTQFGRSVADRTISQSDFAAITIQTFSLPNIAIQSQMECKMWKNHSIQLHPLLLLLRILHALAKKGEGYLFKEELIKIIIPLSCVPQVAIEDYVNFILWNRQGIIDLKKWPDCSPRANDHRIAREFLLFLANYGYVERIEDHLKIGECFVYNKLLNEEIEALIKMQSMTSLIKTIMQLQTSGITHEIERKRVQFAKGRPNQARFRKSVLAEFGRCVITNIEMEEVLEAAHIVPYKYKGEDTIANGFCLRTDIHQLFDTGHLRISPSGSVKLSDRARTNYGMSIPRKVEIPSNINSEFVRWRWENYSEPC